MDSTNLITMLNEYFNTLLIELEERVINLSQKLNVKLNKDLNNEYIQKLNKLSEEINSINEELTIVKKLQNIISVKQMNSKLECRNY